MDSRAYILDPCIQEFYYIIYIVIRIGFTKKILNWNGTQCGNCGNSLSRIFGKNFVKVTVLLNELLKRVHLTEYFFGESKFRVFSTLCGSQILRLNHPTTMCFFFRETEYKTIWYHEKNSFYSQSNFFTPYFQLFGCMDNIWI